MEVGVDFARRLATLPSGRLGHPLLLTTRAVDLDAVPLPSRPLVDPATDTLAYSDQPGHLVVEHQRTMPGFDSQISVAPNDV